MNTDTDTNETAPRLAPNRDLVETEHTILSIGSEFLTPEAIKVRDGADLTLTERAVYQTWLADQIEEQHQECECDACTTRDYAACRLYQATLAADVARDAAIEALRASDEPRAYEISDDGATWTIEARPSTLDAEVTKSVRAGSWDTSESWVWSGRSRCTLTGDKDSHEVIFAAREPKCSEPEHDWRSPWSVLGGLRENPGVVGGPNGGVTVREVCAHCGIYREFVSRATNPSNGTTYEATNYADADEDSLAWVNRRKGKVTP